MSYLLPQVRNCFFYIFEFFTGALDGHADGVFCSALSKRNLVQFLTGACDGEVRVWDLNVRKCVWRAYAHAGFVRGLSVAPGGGTFFSCGDKTVKQWTLCVADDSRQVCALDFDASAISIQIVNLPISLVLDDMPIDTTGTRGSQYVAPQ